MGIGGFQTERVLHLKNFLEKAQHVLYCNMFNLINDNLSTQVSYMHMDISIE